MFNENPLKIWHLGQTNDQLNINKGVTWVFGYKFNYVFNSYSF